jgi:hypothetical protein
MASNSDLGEMLILDDLLALRAADAVQVPLLGYPKPGPDITDFELFTGRALDQFVDRAAKEYVAVGLLPVSSDWFGMKR